MSCHSRTSAARSRIAVAGLIAVVVAAGCCAAQQAAPAPETAAHKDRIVRDQVELLHADAVDLAIRFGAEPPRPLTPREQAIRSQTQQGRQQMIMRELSERRRRPFDRPTPTGPAQPEPRPRLVADARLAPRDNTFQGELAQLLPDGLEGPPIALAQRNALLVRGTQPAIDEFREVVKMLDVPAKMVSIQVDTVDAPVRVEEAAGVDFAAMAGQADASLLGNAPGDATLLLRYAAGDFTGIIGAMRRESRGASKVGASVTTMSLHPALISAGEALPFFQPTVGYNAFGQRVVDYNVLSLFVGVELWVLPRVNADDTVTMRLRPTLVDETGMVAGPTGTSAPITRQTLTDTIVRVPDGQTICIAGMPRHQESLSYTFGANGPRRVSADSNLLVFVTPRIIRDAGDR